ncbi:MAG: efflux RND transporter permease subunit [Deltaproteobacteria bacterium]|nr:efflux RND transporter permease subunit [Deltaproteobacteria bacterium]
MLISKLIDFSFKRPGTIFFIVALCIIWAIFAISKVPLDAIPDLSEPQVIIFTEWKGRSPDLIEDQITYPVVSSLMSAPKVKVTRGLSMFGMSFVYVIFDDGTDIYWARSRVLEYLTQITDRLPEGVNPILGPDATGVGWIFQYSLVDESGQNSIEDLRSFQDWKLRYLLKAIPGVAEVASVGGYVKEYQIQVNPMALAQYKLNLDEVMDKVRASNRDVGGRTLELSEREYFIRGLGYIKNIEDIENIPLKSNPTGDAVLIKHIGKVVKVPDIRRGAIDLNGRGEAVSAIVVMRYGNDAYSLIQKIKDTLKSVEPSLPKGSKIVITYDRSKVIGNSIRTLKTELWDEMIVVALVILVFLWHFRSSLIPIFILPISVLFSFIPMYYWGINSNIMSLGGIAIAIGALVDSAIVVIENAHKALEHWREQGEKGNLLDALLQAVKEVGTPIFFALLVMAVSFLPIFVLEGQEGKLFKPLALTKTFSLFFGAVLAATLAPALVRFFLNLPKPLKLKNPRASKIVNFFWTGTITSEENHPISARLFKIYTPALDWVLKRPFKIAIASLLIILTIIPFYAGIPLPLFNKIFPGLKKEFMPSLNEGDLLYMPTTLPGISIEKAKEWLQQQDKLILQFKEVATIFGKAGRAETPTDPAPLSMVETVIQLHPQEDWPEVYHERWYSNFAPNGVKIFLRPFWPEMKPRNWQELVKALQNTIQLPGTSNAWVFPIKTRIDMLTTGIRTPIGIKIYGDELNELEKIAVEIERVLLSNPEFKPITRSAIAERSLGGFYIDIKLKRDRLGAYGIGSIEEANSLIEGVLGAEPLTTTIEKRERYSVSLRYQPHFRSSFEQIKNALITSSNGSHIPLSEVADVNIVQGPAMIRNENGLLSSWVFVDLDEEVDMSAYAEKLDDFLRNSSLLPEGYTYKISGQFEHLKRAERRLWMVIPLTLLIIFLLLYTSNHSLIKTCIVLLAIPFSLVGAFGLLWLLGYKLSIAVWVGIIALGGVDAETGTVMLLYLDLAYKKFISTGKNPNSLELKKIIHDGAVKRIRPKLMTVGTTFMGLLPIMWAGSHETGADVTKRIAAPMVGGIFTSFAMELLVYPCLFYLWKTYTKEFERITIIGFSVLATALVIKSLMVMAS